MSRPHQPEDDFSFLPTVDDAELDKEALWAKAKALRQTGPAAEPEQGTFPIPEPAEQAPEAASAPPKAQRFRLKVKPQPRSAPAVPEPASAEEFSPEAAPPEEPAPESRATAVPQVPNQPKATGTIKLEQPASPTKQEKLPATTSREDITSARPSKPAPKRDAVLQLPQIVRPPSAAEHPHKEEEPLTRKQKFMKYWLLLGGRSLMLSLGLHVGILAVAAFIVISNVSQQHVDFLPGGGTSQGEAAEKSLQETVKRKKNPWLRNNPMQRIASSSLVSDIKLPETPMTEMAVPDISRKMDTMGFGTMGAGGGFGSGIGVGGKSGVTFQPIMMFGKDLKARHLAVILDVSSSMTSYLEDVVKEVDRVAKGSPVICYFGCGLMRPEKGAHVDDKIDLCKNPTFQRFWRIWYGPSPFNATPDEIKKIKFNPKDPIPLEDVYRMLAKRPMTYFIDYNGIVYAWTALTNDLVRNADALYWFSDFMDDVEEKEIKIVLENLKRRKQRLFIQPSIHGASFEQVKKGLVEPSGGEVVEPPGNP